MKPFQVFAYAVSFSLAVILLFPYSGMCYPSVDGSFCLACHDTDTLHTQHGFDCAGCHDGTPQAGNVGSFRCLECHTNINAQVCDLVAAHNTYISDCVSCHVQCQSVPDNFCKGNFDFDKDVDGSDASLFKQHFGRSALTNPCPQDGPAPVEKTWQTYSYAPGDDGDAEKGVVWPKPRFKDNGDGTVTDTLTGLIWLKNANCFGLRWWDEALSDCNGLQSGQCGLTDGSSAGEWRLPNYKELLSLVDAENYLPALPAVHPFTNVQNNDYWSSTTYAPDALAGAPNVWVVYMSDGGVGYSYKFWFCYVWPVRGGH